MARIIAAVSCFVAAFHAVAERPLKEGMRLEREAPEAKHDQQFMSQGGIGRTLEEYKADVERHKKLLTHSSTEGRDVQGGDSAMNASFAELGRRAAFQCATPYGRYPSMFSFHDSKDLSENAYQVTISGCKNGNGGPLVMKSVGVQYGDEDEELIKEFAWTEILVGESLSNDPAVVYTFAHIGPHEQTSFNRKGTCFYTLMEYANRGDLLSNLGRSRKGSVKGLSLQQRASIFSATLAGLQGLHKRGIVHRNIKPHNILLQWDAKERKHTPKIGDFHYSCCDGPHCKLAWFTRCERRFIGYMSPQMMKSERATADDDLWSMGKLLLHLVYDQVDIPYLTQEDVAHREYYKKMAQLAKKTFLTDEDKEKVNKNEAAGGGTLVELLDYLLCNACSFKEKEDVDQKAIELSNKWLLKLGVTPHDPKVEQRSEDLQSCIEDHIQSGQFQRGQEAK